MIVNYPTGISTQELQDIAQAKRNSVTDGKGTNRVETDQLQGFDWGWEDGGDMAARTIEARLKRLEDELMKTQQERDTYKRQAEQQTTTTDMIEQRLTTTNLIAHTPTTV